MIVDGAPIRVGTGTGMTSWAFRPAYLTEFGVQPLSWKTCSVMARMASSLGMVKWVSEDVVSCVPCAAVVERRASMPRMLVTRTVLPRVVMSDGK